MDLAPAFRMHGAAKRWRRMPLLRSCRIAREADGRHSAAQRHSLVIFPRSILHAHESSARFRDGSQ